MNEPLEGTIDSPRSRRPGRPGSAVNNSSMSAPSHRRVDEDILKRIRSLLLARNVNNPPRTPYPSDEKLGANFSEDGTSSPKRTLNTAMDRSARREKRLSLPESVSELSRSPSMAIDNTQKPKSPPPEFFIFPPPNLRSSSSAHDLRTSSDIPDGLTLTDGPSSIPGKQKSRLRLVLQDIPKKTDTELKSCVEIGSGKLPENDAALHEDELSCCDPCEKPEEQPSKYLIRDGQWPKMIEAEPSDLACFLAGCSPGQLQCSKHPNRRAQSTSLLDTRPRPQDMEAIGKKPSSDFDKIVVDAKRERINVTTTTDGNHSTVKSVSAGSVTSSDAYPHAVQSQKIAGKKSITMPFSSAIFTNFSLPGPKAKRPSASPDLARKETQIAPDETLPLMKPVELKPLVLSELPRKEPKSGFRSPPGVRTKQSDGSMRSVKSGKRHALLKSSGSDGDPVEIGLPIPPVLSTIKSFGIETTDSPDQRIEEPEEMVSPTQKGPGPYRDLGPEINNTIRDTRDSPVAGHLANLQKTIDLVDNVRERVQDVKQYIPDDDVNKKIDQSLNCAVKSPRINPVDAAYWGFVPDVKDKVEGAVQSAVRSAVQEVVVPKGARKKEASEVYRLLVADSLSNAAKNADEFLKRPSLWNDIDIPQKPEKTFQPDNGMETIPLDLDQIVSPENHKQGSVKIQKKGQAAVNNSIPERFSSKNKVLASKEGALNSSQKSSPKEKGLGLQKRSNEQLAPKKKVNALRATSSADSLRPNVPTKYVFDDRSSVTNISPERKLARKNTIYWLRDLITSNGPGPYEPQLTALPPRVKRGNDNSGTRGRSQTVPSKPSTELYGAANMRARRTEEDSADQVSEINVGRALVHDQFARTIDDLEQLLGEALLVAQQAADNHDPSYMPAILGDANRILKDSRKGLSDSAAYYQRRQIMRSRRTGTYSDDLSSIASIHESLRSYGDSTEFSDDDRLHQNDPDAYRDIRNGNVAIPPKSPQRKRVKDRISTPYRGRSRVLSGDSDTAEAPLMQNDNRDLEYIKAADPRSLPAEIDFAKPPRKYTEPPDDSSPPEALGELIGTGSPPKFYNPDPFTAPTSSGTGRRVSEKSPRRLSPVKQRTDQPVPIIITDDQGIIPVPRGDSITQRCASGGHSEDDHNAVKAKLLAKGVPGKSEVREYIENYQSPPIHTRDSSKALRKKAEQASQDDEENLKLNRGKTYDWQDIDEDYAERCTLDDMKATAKPLSTNGPSIPCSSSTGGASDSSGALDFGIGFVHAGQPGNQRSGNPRITENRGDRSQEQDNSRRYDSRIANGNVNGDYPDRGSKENRGYGSRDPNGNGGGNGGNGGGGNGGYNGKDYGDGDDPSKDPNGGGGYELRDDPPKDLPETQKPRRRKHKDNAEYDLSRKNHLSLREDQHKGFSFARSHKKPTIARDWKPARKRFVATVACVSTALVGILVGIYAGEVPAIQYYIVDFHHYTLLGNVFFYLGLSVPTFFFWPLPLLHGRKPYILGAMALAMPLLFPQAVAVGSIRSPYVRYWRIGLILPRGLMGFCLGFANMNFKSTLTDLFGASLQCENPHQEVVDENDVRRHGGGMGIWLGLWTWSAMGSIGVGFMIGALIINHLPPAWGFYTSIFIIAGVLFLNIITPEVRRSAFRRSVAEVKNGESVSRRLARGEVKMHMVKSGPKWWGEEIHYGYMLSLRMLTQPGFMVMAVYVAWMYAQIVLIIVLLGSLTSKYYKFTSPFVGLSVMSVPLGAMVAIPFQHASLFSRSHNKGPDDDDTTKKKMNWSSHMLRRAIFVLVLPFAGLGYTLSSTGPPIHFLVPILFAALIGFLSNLALAECHGILMETFDTSDLQPGMAGRARGSAGDKAKGKRTNYSSFPRVQSAFAITQALGYCLAAVAVGVGGSAERQLGQQAATGVMAGILLVLSILLLGVLVRFRDVQIIPDSKKDELSQWKNARRTSAFMRAQGVDAEEPWRPIIIGNPTHHTRRMCVLEMGSLTRWSEIRMKNRLVDANSMEAKHPNMVMVEEVEEFFGKKKMDPALLYKDQGNGQDNRVQSYRPQGNANANDEDRLRFTGEDLGDRRTSRRELSSQAGNEGPRRRTGARASGRDQERG